MAIKLRVVDWWNDDNKANFDANPFIKLLRQKYKVVYSDTPDFILCGPFGNKHFDYDCVKIFYTGENTRIDWNLYDYGIGFDYMDFGDKYLRMPLFYIYDCVNECRNLNKRDKFCSYLVRHSGAFLWEKSGGFRDRFFDKLSEYKRVDSGGKWRNNIGGTIDELYGKNTKNMFAVKRKWLENYKFNICFENSSYPGYLTEKLMDAYNAGCIPIYWGDTSLRVGGNSSLTRPSRELEKSSFDRQQVLSHSDFSAQPTNLTQDTRIANNSKDSSLLDSALQNRGNPHNNSMGGGESL